MRGRPNRRTLRARLSDVTPGGDTPMPSVTIEHYRVELPDAARVDPDDSADTGGPGDDVDTTPRIEERTRRIVVERDGGEWTGDMAVDDDVDLSDGPGGDGQE